METRENMELTLTTQMLSELQTMNLKTEEWQQTVYARIQSQLKSLGRLTPDLLQKTKTVTAVMNTYKVSLENMLCDTDIKKEKMKIFETLFIIQSQLKLYHTINGRFDNSTEDDHRRYLDMAMKIDPNDPHILQSYALHLYRIQVKNDFGYNGLHEMDYSYIEYLRKAVDSCNDSNCTDAAYGKMRLFHLLKLHEGFRDYYTPSLRHINHLIQLDKKLNLELNEPRCEIYKISLSFLTKAIHIEEDDVPKLKGSNHRVLFQNAEGTINMGVYFNDPDVEWSDIYWYNTLALEIIKYQRQFEGFTSFDEKLKAYSCCVELHSHPVGINGRNNIIAVTPMKFLPMKEFEKRHKTIDSNRTLAIMNSMMTKTYDVIDKKKKALKLKEIGNDVFKKKDYENAEKFYSRGLEMNLDSRSLWTNRANCRNKMEKYKEALEDSVAALSIDPKCTKSITQKGNALMGLGQFEEAKKCYESLRTFGEKRTANCYLKKLAAAQSQKLDHSDEK